MGAPGQIWVTELDQTYGEDIEANKGLRLEDDKSYRWVKFAGAGAPNLVKGSVCDYNAITADGSTATVQRNTGVVTALFAGVVVANNPAQDSYGWIQVKGPADLNTSVPSSPLAGTKLTRTGANTDQLITADGLADPQAAVMINPITDTVMLTVE